ncbi:hypothetical protein BC831DRAFT_441822 [Entophlyctis helioformis]|nr:hypothetical protein BC831DRAFT_441822 [Entophlyctis helioformis]
MSNTRHGPYQQQLQQQQQQPSSNAMTPNAANQISPQYRGRSAAVSAFTAGRALSPAQYQQYRYQQQQQHAAHIQGMSIPRWHRQQSSPPSSSLSSPTSPHQQQSLNATPPPLKHVQQSEQRDQEPQLRPSSTASAAAMGQCASTAGPWTPSSAARPPTSPASPRSPSSPRSPATPPGYATDTDSINVRSDLPATAPAAPAAAYRGPIPNMAFNPQPSQSDKCRKLKLKLVLDRSMYVAGSVVDGSIALTSFSKSNVSLGEISVEIRGTEEIRSTNTARTFLVARVPFQGDRMPPSAAVDASSLVDGHYTARKGKTVFPFTFALPSTAPSSYTLGDASSSGSGARVRYTVTAVVQYRLRGKPGTLIKSVDADVVECGTAVAVGAGPVRRSGEGVVKNGMMATEGGLVSVEASVSDAVLCAGSDVFIDIRVVNGSGRKIQGFKVSLIRQLRVMDDDTESVADDDGDVGQPALTDVAAETTFNDRNYAIDAKDERSSRVHIHIPSGVRTIRKTALATVSCVIQVALATGYMFTPEVFVDLPVHIYHAASINPQNATALGTLSRSPSRGLSPSPSAWSPSPSPSPTSPTPSSPIRSWGAAIFGAQSLSPSPHNALDGQPRVLPWSDDEDDDADGASPAGKPLKPYHGRLPASEPQQQDRGRALSPSATSPSATNPRQVQHARASTTARPAAGHTATSPSVTPVAVPVPVQAHSRSTSPAAQSPPLLPRVSSPYRSLSPLRSPRPLPAKPGTAGSLVATPMPTTSAAPRSPPPPPSAAVQPPSAVRAANLHDPLSASLAASLPPPEIQSGESLFTMIAKEFLAFGGGFLGVSADDTPPAPAVASQPRTNAQPHGQSPAAVGVSSAASSGGRRPSGSMLLSVPLAAPLLVPFGAADSRGMTTSVETRSMVPASAPRPRPNTHSPLLMPRSVPLPQPQQQQQPTQQHRQPAARRHRGSDWTRDGHPRSPPTQPLLAHEIHDDSGNDEDEARGGAACDGLADESTDSVSFHEFLADLHGINMLGGGRGRADVRTSTVRGSSHRAAPR